MKYCELDGLKYPDSVTYCTACGSALVDALDVEKAQTQVPPTVTSPSFGCPNPQCSMLAAPAANANFCLACGSKLKPISFDLWMEKYVEPALNNDLAEVAQDPEGLFRAAEEMGLPRKDAERFLDQALAEQTGVSRDVFNHWLQNNVIPLTRNNTEDARRQAILRAKELGMPAPYAVKVLRQFVSIPDQPVLVTPQRTAPLTQPVLDDLPASRSVESAATEPIFARSSSYGAPPFTTPANNQVFPFKRLLFGGIVVLIGAGLLWLLFLRPTSPTASNSNQSKEYAGGEPSSNTSTTDSSAPAPDSPTTADSELQKLKQKRVNAPLSQKTEVMEALKIAEKKYPNDYRFPYERAKLSIVGTREHDEAFDLLFLAGQKAIDSNKTGELLNALGKDQISDLHKLTDHREWKILQQALRSGDKSALDTEAHH